MMIYILFVSWVVTTCVVADAELHPIKTKDLESIVDSVKKDVDRHLKRVYAGRRMESIPDSPEFSTVIEDTDNGEYRNFMKMIQESMHHHLVRNLGQPSDEENEGSTVYMKPTPESTSTLFSIKSASEGISNANEDHSEESSSQIYQIRVGSTKGVPGVNFPDYTDIPITSFTCEKKPHFPGFYADLDTGCQVFHVCWPDRRESFLCPMGTTFNQALKVCDYWYNSNCSLAPYYYAMNTATKPDLSKANYESASSVHNTFLENADSETTHKPDSSTYDHVTSDSVMPFISQFIPMKAKIVVYPKTATQRLKIVTTASIGEIKTPVFKQKPGRKNRISRVPRSLENRKPTEDAGVENSAMFPSERTSFLLFEALDLAVMDIESNETLSYLSEYARKVVKKIKSFFLWLTDGDPQKYFGPEPGSEVYKDMMEDSQWVTDGLALFSLLMEQFEKMKKLHELKYSKAGPLTNLNPRFVIKPSAEQTSGLQNTQQQTLVNGVKLSKTISNPSKFLHEDRLNIHPETKKLLLKNYMKLFKSKHA